MHPSGRSREPHVGFRRLRSRRRPGTQTHQLRRAVPPGRRATARGQRALQADNGACWALGRPGQGLKPERLRRRAKFAEKGLPGHPHRGLRAPSPFPAGPAAWDTGEPRDVPTGVSVWMGEGARSRSPQTPQSPTPAARARRARRSRANSWTGRWQPGRPLLSPGAPRHRAGGRSGCSGLFSFNSARQALARSRQPRQPRPPPRVHRPPRPAARASLRAPGRPARALRCWRCEPRAPLPGSRTRGAQESGPLPAGPRSSELRTGAPSRLSVHPCGRSRGAGGRPLIRNTEESAFQPQPGTHALAHPPASGRRAGRSPES